MKMMLSFNFRTKIINTFVKKNYKRKNGKI